MHEGRGLGMARILLVEDDADIRVDLAEILASEGHEVRSAGHGEEALSVLRAGFAPDIILLDLMMPVMDGWQFRAEQLADPALRAIPVLLLSGASNVREAVTDLKAAGYVSKPIRLEVLMKSVDAHSASC